MQSGISLAASNEGASKVAHLHILKIFALGRQDLQQALGPTVAVRMAAAGVPGDVTLLSTRSGTDLDPFILVSV